MSREMPRRAAWVVAAAAAVVGALLSLASPEAGLAVLGLAILAITVFAGSVLWRHGNRYSIEITSSVSGLTTGSPVKIMGLDAGRVSSMQLADHHTRVIVEIEVARSDLLGDCKWTDYLEYCDRFFWAVPPALAAILEEERYLPQAAGLIVADRYDAAIVRGAADRPLAPARRKAEVLRFARRAARRLSQQIDPTLGDGN